MNCNTLTANEIQLIFKLMLDKISITYPAKARYVNFIPMPKKWGTRDTTFFTQYELQRDEQDTLARSVGANSWSVSFEDVTSHKRGKMRIDDYEHGLDYWREFLGLIQKNSSDFNEFFDSLNIKKKAATKEKARQASKARSEKKKLVNFTYPDQRYIVQEVNRFFNVQCVEALRQATVQMGIDQIIKPFIETRFLDVKFKMLWSFDINSGKPTDFDATGKKLHTEMATLPYYKEAMEHLFNATKQSYHSEDRAAACRRFAIVYGDKLNYAVGMVDTHELVRKLSISKCKEEKA